MPNIKKKIFTIPFLIFIFAIIVRVYRLPEIPPPIHVDEAFMSQAAIAILERNKNLLDTYFSSTIISNWLTAFFFKILGISPLSMRLASVIYGISANILLYYLIKELYNKRVGLISFFIANFSHLAIAYSRINLPNIQAPFLFLLSFYFITWAIRKQKSWLFFLGGLLTGSSLYSYSGAKIIVITNLLFLIMNRKKLKIKFWFSLIMGLLTITTPLIFYITKPNNNYLERENQVFILTNHRYWHDRWQTNNLGIVLINQLKTNFLSFLYKGDYSNQYGNGPLLDRLSAFFFLTFFFVSIPIMVRFKKNRKIEEARALLFFLVFFLMVLILITFTESPPLSTRLVILYPVVSLFISLGINYPTFFLKKDRLIKSYLTIVLLTILFLNLKIYFYDYVRNKNAYYSWIEPNSSIGFYIQRVKNRKVYLLPNPHTYAQQPIISVLNYYKKNKIIEIKTIEEFKRLMTMNQLFDIIIPLVPKEAVDNNHQIQKLILESTKSNHFKRKFYWGIPCTRCDADPIFIVLTKIK